MTINAPVADSRIFSRQRRIKILVVGNEVVQKFLGRCAEEGQQQRKKGERLLYDRGSFQLKLSCKLSRFFGLSSGPPFLTVL